MFKVRFHLGKGKNFMHWRIEDLNKKDIKFYNPDKNYLMLNNAKLVNYPKQAKHIFNGSNKVVCAWIVCDSIEVLKENTSDKKLGTHIRYNPRKNLHWNSGNNKNIDGYIFHKLITDKNNVFECLN